MNPYPNSGTYPVPGEQDMMPTVEIRPFTYQISNLQGIGTCERQEDSFGFVNALDDEKISRRGLLAVLADGMGGMSGGKLASETTVATMRGDFEEFDMSGDIPRQLCSAAAKADDIVFGQLAGKGGSTLIACLFYREKLYFVSAGDSFLYLMRNGSLYRINAEHNVLHRKFEDRIADKDISLRSITNERENRAVTRYIGCGKLRDPDRFVRPLPLYVGDIVMLCSDGVANVLPPERIVEALESPSVDEMCRMMNAEISDNPTGQYRDNYTALLIRCAY
ncbi:MAG: protein phosphatase 2C domain-containing protein [Ruminiclostridium sp.]|nr:protein phosphatase 2C domain-containing protein [Ruminiclostridium sp.]